MRRPRGGPDRAGARGRLVATQVSKHVNSVKNDDPECVLPASGPLRIRKVVFSRCCVYEIAVARTTSASTCLEMRVSHEI